MKREIALLAAKTDKVKWPEGTHYTFDRYSTEVQRILLENGLGDEWGYSPEEKLFATTWTSPTIYLGSPGEGFRVEARISVALDPSEPLEQEIERLLAELEKFRQRCHRITFRETS